MSYGNASRGRRGMIRLQDALSGTYDYPNLPA